MRLLNSAVSWIVLAGSFFHALPGLTAPVPLDKLEASVNSALILSSDVDNFRKTAKLRGQLDPIFATSSVGGKGDRSSTADIVEYLIDEKLIAQAFPVTDAEVEQEITAIQNNNRIDRSTLRNALAEQGYSFDDYFEMIRASASKRNLIDRDIRTKVTISDDDVKNYYLNHYTKAAGENRSYHLQVIFVSPTTFKTSAAAKDAAQRALQAVRAGEAFEEVARRSSDDASAASGGDLGSLTEDQMSPIIRDQARKLQVGQVSDVFGSPSSGYYIIKLLDVKADDGGRFSKLKEEIRAQLTAAEYQHQISLWLERQRHNAFVHRAGETSIPGANSSVK